MWIESHQELRDHPKVKKLARLMSWDYCHALGHLQYFWLWCLQYATDGDLRRYDAEQLAEAAGLPISEADKFVDAMVRCGESVDDAGNKVESGFIDREPYFRLHDWFSYIGKYLKSKYSDRPQEWAKVQKLYTSNKVAGRKVNPLAKKRLDEKFFNEIFERYPDKSGKKAALKHFNTTVKTMDDYKNMDKALANYLKCERVRKGFVQNASTWFNNWQDWLKPTPAMMGNLAPGAGVKGKTDKYAEIESNPAS